jgi:hypothetical protein
VNQKWSSRKYRYPAKFRVVQVPGETVVVTVVVEKEVVKTVEVPGETVVKEVVKTVEVPGQTVVKEVVRGCEDG